MLWEKQVLGLGARLCRGGEDNSLAGQVAEYKWGNAAPPSDRLNGTLCLSAWEWVFKENRSRKDSLVDRVM